MANGPILIKTGSMAGNGMAASGIGRARHKADARRGSPESSPRVWLSCARVRLAAGLQRPMEYDANPDSRCGGRNGDKHGFETRPESAAAQTGGRGKAQARSLHLEPRRNGTPSRRAAD